MNAPTVLICCLTLAQLSGSAQPYGSSGWSNAGSDKRECEQFIGMLLWQLWQEMKCLHLNLHTE